MTDPIVPNELVLTESRTARQQYGNRTDVLDKVRAISFLTTSTSPPKASPPTSPPTPRPSRSWLSGTATNWSPTATASWWARN
jgi:hypothetical protein